VTLGPCEVLVWDSIFFGFRIARVRGDVLTLKKVQEIDSWCDQLNVRCLYFLSCADDAATSRLAEENNFKLVDIRMEFVYNPSNSEIRDHNNLLLVRHAVREDIEPLQTMTRGNFRHTRFYFDQNFSRHHCDLLYETWLQRSFEGYARSVLVIEQEGSPTGFITCHLDEEQDIGKIGLIGVGMHAQGQGVGQTLIASALDWLLTHGAREVRVATQGRNVAAQRLYQRCGFLTRTVHLWYHKWYLPE
jgi:dTDP-4-amino-4,6-dideoxy-D-galactose acyltransferase